MIKMAIICLIPGSLPENIMTVTADIIGLQVSFFKQARLLQIISNSLVIRGHKLFFKLCCARPLAGRFIDT